MIAAERFDLTDAVRATPISTSTIPRMRTRASSLNSSLLGAAPEWGAEGVDERREERGKEKSSKVSLRGAREQEEALDLI